MEKLFKKNEAVSPVVGVLLMLIVTIIIAAIVSGFAGGMAGNQQKTPQASIDIQTAYSVSGTNELSTFGINFIHKGGETIDTSEVNIITMLELPNGTLVRHVQTPKSLPAWTGSASNLYSRFPHYSDAVQTHKTGINQAAIEAGEDPKPWFGNFALTPGSSMRIRSNAGLAAFLGLVPEASIYPLNSADYDKGVELLEYCIDNRTSVDVRFLHVPSQKYILEKKFTLEA